MFRRSAQTYLYNYTTMKQRLQNLRTQLAANLSMPISLKKFSIILSVLTLLLYHYPLFKYIIGNIEHGFNGILILLTMIVVMLVANFMVYYLLLYLGRIVGRILLSLFFIGNSIALYFINNYNVLVDRTMMGNVFNTRFSEASGYFSFSGVLYFMLLGVLPAIYIMMRKIDWGTYKRFMLNTVISLASIIVVAIANMTNFPWIDRNATTIGSLIMPWSYIANTARYFHKQHQLNREEIKLPDATITNEEREIVVLVIGESARRDHFSLYGYKQETNPLLKDDNVVALVADASATYTTEGVKAILDHKPTKELYEILPNYLYRNGVDVVWRSTNWGEPPLHIEHIYNLAALKERYPEANGNYDGILLEGLKEEIEACEAHKVLIVLHTSTSHGPEYYAKYPEEFTKFTPVCTTVEMAKAEQSELINAYDNTILYTDYLLHSVIEVLREVDAVRSTMIFVSDHGESLGEGNRFMHGLPMAVAPKEQYEIPFIVWCSDREQKIKPLDKVGHYHVFHSVLNFLSIDSPIYDESTNIFE